MRSSVRHDVTCAGAEVDGETELGGTDAWLVVPCAVVDVVDRGVVSEVEPVVAIAEWEP